MIKLPFKTPDVQGQNLLVLAAGSRLWVDVMRQMAGRAYSKGIGAWHLSDTPQTIETAKQAFPSEVQEILGHENIKTTETICAIATKTSIMNTKS